MDKHDHTTVRLLIAAVTALILATMAYYFYKDVIAPEKRLKREADSLKAVAKRLESRLDSVLLHKKRP